MGNSLQYAQQLLGVLPQFLTAGMSVFDLIAKGQQVLASGNDPTADDWKQLNDRIADLRRQLHSPEA